MYWKTFRLTQRPRKTERERNKTHRYLMHKQTFMLSENMENIKTRFVQKNRLEQSRTQSNTHVQAHPPIRAHTHIPTHMHTHTYTHAHAHTHIPTHIHARIFTHAHSVRKRSRQREDFCFHLK